MGLRNGQIVNEANAYAKEYLKSNHIPVTEDRINAFNIGYVAGYEKCYDEHKGNLCYNRGALRPFRMTRTVELRREFWKEYPEFKERYYSSKKSQNDYPTDVRCAWVDYVENCRRSGCISERLAQTTTL